MTPRLRVLFLTPEKSALVVDRAGDDLPAYGTIDQYAKELGLAGGMAFADEIDFDDGTDDPEDWSGPDLPIAVRDAIHAAIGVFRTFAGGGPVEVGHDPGRWRAMAAILSDFLANQPDAVQSYDPRWVDVGSKSS